MDHAHDIINHMPEAGDETRVQRAGGVPLDIDTMCEVFGALVYYYEAPERRSIGAIQTDTSGRKAIYVGRSRTVSGGHRVMPMEYRQGVWHLGPVCLRTILGRFEQQLRWVQTLQSSRTLCIGVQKQLSSLMCTLSIK